MGELLWYLGLFFIVLLLCLIVVAKFSKPPKEKPKETKQTIDFEIIMITLESRDSSDTDLRVAINEFFANYDSMELNNAQKKTLIFALSQHPKAKSDLILSTLNRLIALNEDLQSDLDKAMQRGLNRRM